MKDFNILSPGSIKAKESGCNCHPLDNNLGYGSTSITNTTKFIINMKCKLHMKMLLNWEEECLIN